MDKKILIIDDDRAALEMMEQTLAPFYDVLAKSSGVDALSALHDLVRKASPGTASAASSSSGLPDLILLDIDMPGMDGYKTLDHLRSEEPLKDIPVVFLTGLTDEQAEMQGLERNVLDYLKKPVGMRVLLMRVHHYLNLTSSRRDQDSLDPEKLSGLCEPLSGREMAVANLMGQFRSDREISEMLNISMPYTKRLVGIVKDKMNLEKRGDIRKYLKK